MPFYYHAHYLNLRNDIELYFKYIIMLRIAYFISKAHSFWFSLPFILYIFDIEQFNIFMYS